MAVAKVGDSLQAPAGSALRGRPSGMVRRAFGPDATPPKPRAVIYGRQALSGGRSLIAQLEASRALAARNGYDVVGEVVDDGIAATVPVAEWPGAGRLIELLDLADPPIDAVVVTRIDRLGRDFDCVDSFTQILREAGTHLVVGP